MMRTTTLSLGLTLLVLLVLPTAADKKCCICAKVVNDLDKGASQVVDFCRHTAERKSSDSLFSALFSESTSRKCKTYCAGLVKSSFVKGIHKYNKECNAVGFGDEDETKLAAQSIVSNTIEKGTSMISQHVKDMIDCKVIEMINGEQLAIDINELSTDVSKPTKGWTKIAGGGGGHVFTASLAEPGLALALYPATQQPVAIKELYASKMDRADTKGMNRELAIWMTLQPGQRLVNVLPHLHGISKDDEHNTYIVMERGIDSIEGVLEKGTLPRPKVMRFSMQLTEAVVYMHKHGVYHMDLKQGNVVLKQSGNDVMVIDFGAAGKAFPLLAPSPEHSWKFVETTPYCAPPEVQALQKKRTLSIIDLNKVWGEHEMDPFSYDVWGTCMIIAEMLYGNNLRDKFDDRLPSKYLPFPWEVNETPAHQFARETLLSAEKDLQNKVPFAAEWKGVMTMCFVQGLVRQTRPKAFELFTALSGFSDLLTRAYVHTKKLKEVGKMAIRNTLLRQRWKGHGEGKDGTMAKTTLPQPASPVSPPLPPASV